MAEVTPLLTRQAWELVTPVTASGVATGSAVGGAAGLAIAAGAVLAVCAVVALVKNRRPSKKKSPARSERRTARTGAGLFDRITGLGARRRTGTRPATNRSGGAGGSTGGARRALANLFGRFRTAPPGRGRRPASSTARSGTPTGSRPGQHLAGRFRRRSAGAGSRPGRSSNRGWSTSGTRRNPSSRARGGQPSGGARAGRSGSQSGGRTSGRPGLVRRARNLARAARVARAARATSPATTTPKTSRGARFAKTARYLAGRPTRPITGTSTTGPRERRRLLARGTSEPRTKRQQLAAEQHAASGRRGTSAVARRAIDNAITSTAATRRRILGGPTMPVKRRPQINKTGLAPSAAARLGTVPSTGRNPFQGVIEACDQAAAGYSPENALRVIEWYEGMSQLIEAMARMFAVQGEKNAEQFYLYPAAAEIAQALGTKFAAYAGPCDEARAAFQAAHAEDLERIRNPKPHQEKWDILVNRE